MPLLSASRVPLEYSQTVRHRYDPQSGRLIRELTGELICLNYSKLQIIALIHKNPLCVSGAFIGT